LRAESTECDCACPLKFLGPNALASAVEAAALFVDLAVVLPKSNGSVELPVVARALAAQASAGVPAAPQAAGAAVNIVALEFFGARVARVDPVPFLLAVFVETLLDDAALRIPLLVVAVARRVLCGRIVSRQ
jgi:hypothetical protein